MTIPLLGWSAGDIVVPIQILTQVSFAFRNAGGAKASYAEAWNRLTSLTRVLECVRVYANTTSAVRYRDEILAQIAIIDPQYKKVEDYLWKYDKSLSSPSTQSVINVSFRAAR